MAITIKELVNERSLEGIQVLTDEHHLSRSISTVTVLDAPDGPSWLKGDELVLTSGYIFKDEEELITFVKYLIKANACGLGIKLNRFHKEIPKEIVDWANQHAFSLVIIPYHYVWSDVISLYYGLKERSEHQNHQILSKDIYSLYVASKWGTSQFAHRLVELLDCEIVVFTHKNELVYSHRMQMTDLLEIPGKSLINQFKNRYIEHINDSYYLFKKGIERDKSLFFVIRSNSKAQLEGILEVIVMLDRLKKNEHLENSSDEQYGIFLNQLTSQTLTQKELIEFQENQAIDSTLYSAIAVFENKDVYRVFNYFKEVVYREIPKDKITFHHYLQFSDSQESLLVLIVVHKELLLKVAEIHHAIHDAANKYYEKTRDCVVISEFYPKLENIQASYEQTKQALNIGCILYPDQPFVPYDKVALYDFASQNQLNLLNFYEIELLIEQEEKNSYDIIRTLEVYLEEKNFKKAAARLFLHENTLRYRIQKITDILSVNLDDIFFATKLLMKIKLWKLI